MMLNRRRSSSVAVLVAATTMMMMTAADAYQVLPPPTCRRDFFVNSLVTAGVIMGAAVEPAEASARGYHISQKLKQEEQKKRLSAPIQAITPTGVAIQEYTKGRSGSGALNTKIVCSVYLYLSYRRVLFFYIMQKLRWIPW